LAELTLISKVVATIDSNYGGGVVLGSPVLAESVPEPSAPVYFIGTALAALALLKSRKRQIASN